MDPFRWCFIGAGKLANIVAGKITASGRHQIASVYTRNPAKGQAFADAFGANAYLSAEQAIADPRAEAVYIATTHPSHYQYARMALELGKPVLCEKTMTMRCEETEALFRLAKEKGLYLSEAMWTWFAPAARQVERWVRESAFGTIEKVHVHMCGQGWQYAPRVTDPEAGGGALLDEGVYALTYLYRLFGYPRFMRCKGNIVGGIDRDDEIELEFSGGIHATISLDLYGNDGEWLLIEGDQASIRFPNFHWAYEVQLCRKDGTTVDFNQTGGYLNEFDLVAQEIRTGKTESEYVPPKQTVDVLRLLDEARRQIGLRYAFEPADHQAVDPARFSLMTFPLRSAGIQSKLETARLAGLRMVDLMDVTEEELPEYQRTLKEKGLQVQTYMPHVSFVQGEASVRDTLQREMRIAHALGAQVFMIIPYYFEEIAQIQARTDKAIDEMNRRCFALAVEMGKDYGFTVAFETTPLDEIRLSGTEDCRRILEAVPGLGLVFDTANMQPHGDDPMEALEALKDHIVYVHLKDVTLSIPQAGDTGYRELTKEGKQMDRALWGQGVVPVKALYERLRTLGYQGNFAIEFAAAPDKENAQKQAEQIDRFLKYLE